MPEGRVEFAKIPVGSNSFDHWELAEYPRSNKFDPSVPGMGMDLQPERRLPEVVTTTVVKPKA